MRRATWFCCMIRRKKKQTKHMYTSYLRAYKCHDISMYIANICCDAPPLARLLAISLCATRQQVTPGYSNKCLITATFVNITESNKQLSRPGLLHSFIYSYTATDWSLEPLNNLYCSIVLPYLLSCNQWKPLAVSGMQCSVLNFLSTFISAFVGVRSRSL